MAKLLPPRDNFYLFSKNLSLTIKSRRQIKKKNNNNNNVLNMFKSQQSRQLNLTINHNNCTKLTVSVNKNFSNSFIKRDYLAKF